MGVNTKSFDNASDMITFSRASGAYGLTKVSYGPELVTNGTFDSDPIGSTPSTWETNTANASLIKQADGTALFASTSFAYARIVNASRPILPVGLYKVSFEISEWSGSLALVHVGINSGGNVISGNGTYSYIFTSTAEQAYEFQIRPNGGGTGSFKIDNISVKEVTYNSSSADANLQLTYHPNDVPRIEYNTDGTAKGLLVEEARTNNLPYSEDFTEWTALGVTVNSNNVISPDKNLNGTKLTSSGSGTQRVGRNINTTGVNCYSVFAKKGTHSYLQILDGSDAEYYVNFDLDSGSVGTSGSKASGQIQDFGNGWYRCTMVTDGTSSTSKFYIYLTSNASSGYGNSTTSTNYFYIYGAQFEAGAFPTSYIKTTGAPATRSTDIASIPVADFGYNQSEGTLLIQASSSDDAPSFAALSDTTANNRLLSYVSASNIRWYILNGGASQGNLASGVSYSEGDTYKIANAYKTDDFAINVNGETSVTDTSGSMPSGLSILNIGTSNSASAPINGHIKSIKYYPRRLTDAQLQELTT